MGWFQAPKGEQLPHCWPLQWPGTETTAHVNIVAVGTRHLVQRRRNMTLLFCCPLFLIYGSLKSKRYSLVVCGRK